MAKTSTLSTRSPYQFATGQGVYEDESQAVCEMLNYAFQNSSATHVSLVAGNESWETGGGEECPTHNVFFPSTLTTMTQYYYFRIWVDPDVQSIIVGAICDHTIGKTGNIRFTIGAATATISFTIADNNVEKTATGATSSTGTGWLVCQVELEKTAGAGNGGELLFWRVENVIPATLPSPVSE